MSLRTVLFATMCPSTVRCRRGGRTIAPLSRVLPVRQRPPTAASVHSQDAWVVCGLPEPTYTSSTKTLCDTGVALSMLGILVCSGSRLTLLTAPRARGEGCAA